MNNGNLYKFDPIFGQQTYPLTINKDKTVHEELSRFLNDKEMFDPGEIIWIECDPSGFNSPDPMIIIRFCIGNPLDKDNLTFPAGGDDSRLYFSDIQNRFVEFAYLDVLRPDNKLLVIGYRGGN